LVKLVFNKLFFIDDREENIETAKKLGMKTILFKGVELKKDLKTLVVIC